MKRFVKVNNNEQLKKIIDNINKTRGVIDSELEQKVVGDQMLVKEATKVQKPILQGLDEVKKAVALAAEQNVNATNNASLTITGTNAKGNRTALGDIFDQLVANNSNLSIIKLLAELKQVGLEIHKNTSIDDEDVGVGSLLKAISELKDNTQQSQDDILEQLKSLNSSTMKQLLKILKAQAEAKKHDKHDDDDEMDIKIGEMLKKLKSSYGSKKGAVANIPPASSLRSRSRSMPSNIKSNPDTKIISGNKLDIQQPPLPANVTGNEYDDALKKMQNKADKADIIKKITNLPSKESNVTIKHDNDDDHNDADDIEIKRYIDANYGNFATAGPYDVKNIKGDDKFRKIGDSYLQIAPLISKKVIITDSLSNPTTNVKINKTVTDGTLTLIMEPMGKKDTGILKSLKDFTNYGSKRSRMQFKIPEYTLDDFYDYADIMNTVGFDKYLSDKKVRMINGINASRAAGQDWDGSMIQLSRYNNPPVSEPLMIDTAAKDKQKLIPITTLLGKKKTAHGIEPDNIKLRNLFKMQPNGQFGNIHIDPHNLNRQLLTAYDGNRKRICHQPCDYDLIHLLKKKYDSKRNYSPHSIDLFDKLLKHSGLSLNIPTSGKLKRVYPNMTGQKTTSWDLHPTQQKQDAGSINHGSNNNVHDNGIQIYTDPDELAQRLNILFGEISASNDNKSLINESAQIIDKLLQMGKINKDDHSLLYKQIGIH